MSTRRSYIKPFPIAVTHVPQGPVLLIRIDDVKG